MKPHVEQVFGAQSRGISPQPITLGGADDTGLGWVLSETGGLETDDARPVMRNEGHRAVVPMETVPRSELTGLLTGYDAEMYTADPGYGPRVIEAVRHHLQPSSEESPYVSLGAPETCRYAIKHRETQLVGATSERLLADLEAVSTCYASRGAAYGQAVDGLSHGAVATVVAVCCPVELGWFYLEGVFRAGQREVEWAFGLLTIAPLTDPFRLEPFFSACEVSLPAFALQYPLQAVVGIGDESVEPLTALHAYDIGDTNGAETLLLGENPFYRSEARPTRPGPLTGPGGAFESLRGLETLIYQAPFRWAGEPCAVEEVVMVQPETTHSLFVQSALHRTVREPDSDAASARRNERI